MTSFLTSIRRDVSYKQLLLFLLCLGLLAIGLRILVRLVSAAISPLRRIPGPFAARFTRLWYYQKIKEGEFEKINQQLHQRYGMLAVIVAAREVLTATGKIVRISPNEYSIDDDECLKTIYGHGTTFTKTPWYRASGDPDPKVHNLFTDENSKRHAAEKRKVAHLYSMTTLLEFEPYVETCVHHVLEKLDQFARQQQTINMQHWLQCYAFDTIGLITVGGMQAFVEPVG
jgi:hypothetical protein